MVLDAMQKEMVSIGCEADRQWMVKTYSTEIGDSLGQLGTNVVRYAFKIEDHLGELSPVMLLPHFLFRVDILYGSGSWSGS